MEIDPFDDDQVTIREAAKLLGKDISTVRRWIYVGAKNNQSEIVKLSTIKVGVFRRTSRAAIRAFVDQMSVEGEK